MTHTNKRIIFIRPAYGISWEEQLEDCLLQLESNLSSLNCKVGSVIKQTVFFKAGNNEEYKFFKDRLMIVLEKFYGSFLPPTSFVAQSPDFDKLVALEVFVETGFINIVKKAVDGFNYMVVEHPNYKEVYAAGLSGSVKKTSNISKSSEYSFKLMNKILDAEKLSFDDVVRQWNYIEGITQVHETKGEVKQNYQIFNDIRSSIYDNVNFNNGYPAATGIGVDSGGVIIDFIAISPGGNNKVYQVQSPNQFDAYKYGQEVLIGNSNSRKINKTTPKFERAKLLRQDRTCDVFISGTAAIIGQEITEQSIERQTKITIENILQLISQVNLKNASGIDVIDERISYIRVYVKRANDISVVKSICESYFKGVDVQYLIADICREELLVEIEGSIHFNL